MAPLLENYQEVSKYEPINETLQLMAEDIRESNMTTQKIKTIWKMKLQQYMLQF